MARLGAATRRQLTAAAAAAVAVLGAAELACRRADPAWDVLRPEADDPELTFTSIKLPPRADGGRIDLPKAPGATRVLCLGGSMTAGYPFPGAGWPEQLKAALPSSFEVWNLGRGGYGSARDLLVLEQALRAARPDAVVVFEGHNEVGEALIEEATRATALRRAARAARLLLYRSACGTRLIRRGGPAVRAALARLVGPRSAEKRLRVFGGPTALTGLSAPPGSAEDPRLAAALERRLAAMARLCRERGVPLVLGVPPTDERHLIPIENPWGRLLEAPGALERRSGAVRDFFAAVRAERAGDCRAALPALARASASIDLPALHFLRARCLERRGRASEARAEYARWHEPEPTCGPALRAALRAVARAEGAILVDVDRAWRASSPMGMPDPSLFIDDHHLTLEGYRRVAQLVLDGAAPVLGLGAAPTVPKRGVWFGSKARPHLLLGHLLSIWSSETDPSLGSEGDFHRRAVEEFAQALKLDPSLDDAEPGPDAVASTSEINLAIAQDRLGRRERAAAHLRRAFALRPSSLSAEHAYDLTLADRKLSLAELAPRPDSDFAPLFGLRGARRGLRGSWTGARAGLLLRPPPRPGRAELVLRAPRELLRRGSVAVKAYADGRLVGSARLTGPEETKLTVAPLGEAAVLELRVDRTLIPAAEGLSPEVEPLGVEIREARLL